MSSLLFQPSQHQIEAFLRQGPQQQQSFYRWRLDPARVVALVALEQTLKQHSIPPRQRVAVVSGSLQEPELSLLPLAPGCRIDDLKYPEQRRWDLQREWSEQTHGDVLGRYDAVVCCQVLEHIATPEQGFHQLVKLLAPGGLLVINLPALNGNHGDPDYWFAGFHPRWLLHQAERHQLQVLDGRGWGSIRTALAYAICDWAPWGVIGPLRWPHLREPQRMMAWLRHRIKYGPVLSSLSPLHQPNSGLDRQFTISWLTALQP